MIVSNAPAHAILHGFNASWAAGLCAATHPVVLPRRGGLQARPAALHERELMSGDLKRLQARIGYHFRVPANLERALTHASWLQDDPSAPGNNQRLEFLGDSVLQLVLTEALFALFPEDREGDLTKRRSVLGKGAFLSGLAREIGLDACLRLGANEEATGGRGRDAALEDAFEALVGAVNVDGGLESARRVVLGIYGDLGLRLGALEDHANPKGRLQEIVQPAPRKPGDPLRGPRDRGRRP